MTPDDLAITLIVAIAGVAASYVIARHFYMKEQKKKRRVRRASAARRMVKNDDPLTLRLDPNKPNLGLTEQKVKNTIFALALRKLFFENDSL